MASVKVNIKRRFRTEKLVFSSIEKAEEYIGNLDGFRLIDYIFGPNKVVKQINVVQADFGRLIEL